MSAQQFDVKLSVKTPRVDGGAVAPIDLLFAGSFEAKAELELPVTGTGTVTVQLNGARPCKALVVWADAADTPTQCGLRFNGGTEELPLRSGGCLFYFDSLPGVPALTSLVISHTTAMVLHVVALG